MIFKGFSTFSKKQWTFETNHKISIPRGIGNPFPCGGNSHSSIGNIFPSGGNPFPSGGKPPFLAVEPLALPKACFLMLFFLFVECFVLFLCVVECFSVFVVFSRFVYVGFQLFVSVWRFLKYIRNAYLLMTNLFLFRLLSNEIQILK